MSPRDLQPAPPVKFDVLGLGAVAVDDLLYVDEYPPADRKVRVTHLRHLEILTYRCETSYAHAIWAWHQARSLVAG
jgi:hypothetical protein